MPSQLVAIQAFDANGSPDAGARFNTWRAGTTTRFPVYADEALTTPLPNPVSANAAGVLSAWMDASVTYKFNLTSADGGTELIGTIDNYSPDQESILAVIGRSITTQTSLVTEAVADSQSARDAAQASAQAAAASEQSANADAASASADAASAQSSEQSAGASATSAGVSSASATQRASEAAASATAAQASETAAAASEAVSTDAATDADLSRAAAAASELSIVLRRLPGSYENAAEAAAHPDAAVGSSYLGNDDGTYTLTSINPPASVLSSTDLTPEQSNNLASVPAIRASAEDSEQRLSRMIGGTSGGSSNAYTYASPAGNEATALAFGLFARFPAAFANTSAATLNFDGLGARPLVKESGAALRAGDIKTGLMIDVMYDGASWRLMSPSANNSLTALANLVGAADRLPYFTSESSQATTALSAFARGLLGLTSAANYRSAFGLGALAVLNSITNSQIADDTITFGKLQNMSADRVLGRAAGTGNPIEIACTAAARALMDDANAAAQRATLGAQEQINEALANPGRIEIPFPGATLAFQFGNRTVAANSAVTQNFSRSFTTIYGAGDCHNDNGGGQIDNITAYPLNNFGMQFINGLNVTRTMWWMVVGRV